MESKQDYILLHVTTNDLTNGINTLNSVNNIVKKVKAISPNKRTGVGKEIASCKFN